jgi:hypothetical protein
LPIHACFSRNAECADPDRLDDIPGAESGKWDLHANMPNAGTLVKQKCRGKRQKMPGVVGLQA